jgi:hypothetical protein
MKTWIILALAFGMAACGSPQKNENAAQIPAAMTCPSSQDPSQGCPTPSDPALALGATKPLPPDTPKAQAAARMKVRTKSIEGRCELLIQGEKSPRSCSEVKVMVRSAEKGEMRDGVVDGFAISFTDLNEKSYKLLAQSETYDLTTSGKALKPGTKVFLKIKGKPRSP